MNDDTITVEEFEKIKEYVNELEKSLPEDRIYPNHPELKNDETFVGNFYTGNIGEEFNKLDFRLGDIAYGIFGDEIPDEEGIRPMLVKKNHASFYTKIMEKKGYWWKTLQSFQWVQGKTQQ